MQGKIIELSNEEVKHIFGAGVFKDVMLIVSPFVGFAVGLGIYLLLTKPVKNRALTV